MRTRCAIVALLMLGLLTTGTDASSDAVRFSLDSAGGVRVAVTISGARPLTFLLDTGSSHSVVGSHVAEALALLPIAKTTVLTPTGNETRVVVNLPAVSVGTAVAKRLLASVVPSAQMRAATPGIDGIIGQDFLSAFNYTLDYRNRRLVWTVDAADTGSDVRLTLIRQDGRFLVPLGKSALTPLLLVPDSGAETLVLYERDGRTPLPVARSADFVDLVGFARNAGAQRTVVKELRLGSMTIRNQPAVVVPRAEDAQEGDVLLPLHQFASVSFNSREGYLVLRAR